MSSGGNIQRVVHLKNEPEHLSYRKPKSVTQNENGQENPNNSNSYHDENHDGIELYQGNSKMST